MRAAATSVLTVTVLVPVFFRFRVRPGTTSVTVFSLATTATPSMVSLASAAGVRSVRLLASAVRSALPAPALSLMALAVPDFSCEMDRYWLSPEAIRVDCTPRLRPAFSILVRIEVRVSSASTWISSDFFLSPTPTSSVRVPAPKVLVLETAVSAIHLLAVASCCTSMAWLPVAAALVLVTVRISSVPLLVALTKRASNAVEALSALSEVLSRSNADLTVPTADSCIFALDCCRFSALSAGLRSAATRLATMPEMSSPEPMPP
ncbi:hypothetical protein D3C71_1305630 [compost metagenome]